MFVSQLNFIGVIENLIITENLFDGIQPLINWRVMAYLEISSVTNRYNQFNCILSDCVTDNYRYIILAIFKYRSIALADTIAFTELAEWAFPLFLRLF